MASLIESVLKHAGTTRRLMQVYCNYGLVVYSCFLAKNALVIALNLKSLSRFRWLDCYLVGRLQLGGRIPEASKYMVLTLNLLMILQRIMVKFLEEDILLLFYQFIYTKPAEKDLQMVLRGLEATGVSARKRRFMFSEHVVNLVSATRRPIARPNRVRPRPAFERRIFDLWARLSVLCLALVICLLTWVIMPLIATPRGFELLYPNCVRWILQQQGSNASAAYAFIYRVDPTRSHADIFESEVPFRLPLAGHLVQANLYHLTRLAIEIFEWALTQTDITACYLLYVFVALRISIDLMIYVAHLQARLSAVARELRWPAEFSRALYESPLRERERVSCREQELEAIQAGLLDFFQFIRAYNPYASETFFISAGLWILYVFMIFLRYLKADQLELDNGVQFEFVFLFLVTSMPLIIIMLGEFYLASRSRLLFAQIARVMALDDGNSTTKKRWATLLGFYQPRSLFCFSVNNIELSWLFGLKLFSWVISALIIMRSL